MINDQTLCGSTAGNHVIYSQGELFITKGSEVNCEIRVIGDCRLVCKTNGAIFDGYHAAMDL